MTPDYDLCVIGGGINGAGIARDAAGRGLSVLLVEAQDLAQGTSSASTKLIHGGLRYLERGDIRLVRESLQERETLLHIAPHIVTPMEFILPHIAGLRPPWMIRAGLFLYDHIAGRRTLARSSAVSLHDSLLGTPLQPGYREGYKYSDCWTDDARLVVLNAMDAKARGAEILTRTACLRMATADGAWHVQLKDLSSGNEFTVTAKMVVNAGGPWVRGLVDASGLERAETPNIRLVKGSHIIVPRLYDGTHAYLLQQPDKRVVFAIPYQNEYTLIGTTDEPFIGDAMKPVISDGEKAYLCAAVNRFFRTEISQADIRSTYSGVRALVDDGRKAAQSVTRDYKLDLDNTRNTPILSVFGGKLTTYRRLAEQAVDRITGQKALSGWTKTAPLPGGDIGDTTGFLQQQCARYGFLPHDVLRRYAFSYGTRMDILLENILTLSGMGRDYGAGLYEAEIRYLVTHEFAKNAEDILWRRTKLGLHADKKTVMMLESSISNYLTSQKSA